MDDRGRVYEEVTCPYCGRKEWHSFHILSQTLICDYCDEEFEIELDVTVKVTSTRVLAD